jgi:MATE family multidrug resistance protein
VQDFRELQWCAVVSVFATSFKQESHLSHQRMVSVNAAVNSNPTYRNARWAFELCGIAAGWFGKISLGAQSVILSTASMFFMLPYGMAIACSVRIGHLIGAGCPNHARLACATVLICAGLQSLFNITLLLIFRDWVGFVFTNEEEVVKLVSRTLPVVAAFQIGESCSTTGGGIFRGLGRQQQGAGVNFLGFYVVGLPVGLLLAVYAHFELQGLWWGLCAAIWTVSLTTLFLVSRICWDEEVEKSHRLIQSSDDPEDVPVLEDTV